MNSLFVGVAQNFSFLSGVKFLEASPLEDVQELDAVTYLAGKHNDHILLELKIQIYICGNINTDIRIVVQNF
jgi:hypothetical protein